MPRTQEIPQAYPENIPLVSLFQGYNPETMAQVEGPQQGGWVPLMQDPITMGALAGGGAAVAGIPGMFAQLAQMYGPQMVPQAAPIGQPSVMAGYRPGWQKIPNTTEPDLGQYGRPTEEIGWGGGFRGTGIPFPPEQRGHPSRWPTYDYGRNFASSDITPSWIGERGQKTRPLRPSEQPMTEERLRSIVKKGLKDWEPSSPPTAGRQITQDELRAMAREWLRKNVGPPVKIPVTEEGLSVEEALRRHGTPGRPTAPFTVVPGQQVLGGGAPTTELPSLTDLFRGIPE